MAAMETMRTKSDWPSLLISARHRVNVVSVVL
jgi:hypothetical protein